jgi:chemotaxis response regulator CheB
MLEERQFVAVLLDGVGVDGQSGLKQVEGHGALAVLQRERPAAHEVQRPAESAVREENWRGIQRLSANDIAAYLANVATA